MAREGGLVWSVGVEMKKALLDLHRRDKNYNGYGENKCTTCMSQDWPCATAKLLGAKPIPPPTVETLTLAIDSLQVGDVIPLTSLPTDNVAVTGYNKTHVIKVEVVTLNDTGEKIVHLNTAEPYMSITARPDYKLNDVERTTTY